MNKRILDKLAEIEQHEQGAYPEDGCTCFECVRTGHIQWLLAELKRAAIFQSHDEKAGS